MFRKSHLLVTTAGKFNPLQQFIRSDFSFYPWGVLISVRWSKAIQFRERTISIPLPAIPNFILCPVVAIRHAFSMADSCTDSGQAFYWLDKTTLRLRSFTYRYFLDKLRRCWVHWDCQQSCMPPILSGKEEHHLPFKQECPLR